jgi:hypothetical protein
LHESLGEYVIYRQKDAWALLKELHFVRWLFQGASLVLADHLGDQLGEGLVAGREVGGPMLGEAFE